MSDQPHVPMHSAEAHDVITAELVACTLGQRQRLELRVDAAGQAARFLRQFVEAIHWHLRRTAPWLHRY